MSGKKGVRRAIRYIDACRASHVTWADPGNHYTKEQLRVGGGRRHHRMWIRRYDLVLKMLRKIR